MEYFYNIGKPTGLITLTGIDYIKRKEVVKNNDIRSIKEKSTLAFR